MHSKDQLTWKCIGHIDYGLSWSKEKSESDVVASPRTPAEVMMCRKVVFQSPCFHSPLKGCKLDPGGKQAYLEYHNRFMRKFGN